MLTQGAGPTRLVAKSEKQETVPSRQSKPAQGMFLPSVFSQMFIYNGSESFYETKAVGQN